MALFVSCFALGSLGVGLFTIGDEIQGEYVTAWRVLGRTVLAVALIIFGYALRGLDERDGD